MGGLHQHDVGVELPRRVNLEFEDDTRAIRTRKLRAVWMFDHSLFLVPTGALWTGSTNMMLVSRCPDVCNTSLSVFVKWASQLCLRLSERCTASEIFQSSPINSSLLQSRHAAMHV